MTIKSRLNIIALLAVGTILGLYGFLWYTTIRIDNQLTQVKVIDTFTKTASELNIVTEQYLAYGEPRHLESWENLFSRLKEYENSLDNLSELNVISNALPSIESAFKLIQQVRQNPGDYPNIENRNRLLERAQARIRSDIQILLSTSHNIAETRRASLRELQVNQQIKLLLILIPAVLLIGYMVFQLRTRILNSLQKLLHGTKAISQGNLETRIDIEGSEEHEVLAEAFNSMTSRLQKQIRKEREARKDAEENQRRWEKLVEQDPNLVMIHIDGEIQFINPAGAQIVGAEKPAELIGKSAYDIIVETKNREEAQKRVNMVEKKSEAAPKEIFKIRGLDGSERYIQFESVPIKYAGQDATQTVGLEITDRINYENELKESVEEKTILLQEIHHRVKNNLAVVSGLLYMQRQTAGSNEVTELLGESERRIKSMALIHETLYHSSNLSSIPIKKYMRELINTIQDTFDPEENITVNILSDSFDLNVNQAVPCALIVNELVSNAFKHAFANGDGTIEIHIKENNDIAEISISDDGKGIPEKLNPQDSKTLGFTIIKTLIKQLNSQLEIETERGTTVRFNFKKKEISGSSSNLL